MSSGENSGFLIRFDAFEVDLRTGELRRRGLRVRLRDQSFQVLAMLLERPGQLVSREELQRKLWSTDTFVDFDRGLNKAINRLRDALGDSAEAPSFIETLPKRGYRFIAPLEDSRAASFVPLPAPPAETRVEPDSLQATPITVRTHTRIWRLLTIAALLAVTAAQTSSRVARSTPRPSSSSGRRIMLAVLPFENLTGDNEQEYLSEGMTEEMITRLGTLQPNQLAVIARASVMGYKHNHDLNQIARELGVQYVVDGSIRGGASQLRVAVQVIRIKDQTRLWSGFYENNPEDILHLQRPVAEVADAIQLVLTPQRRAIPDGAQKVSSGAPDASLYEHAKERLAKDHTESREVHQLYFKGRYFWNRRNAQGFQKAIDYFRQALDKDPGYALAYAGLADCYLLMGGFGIAPQKEMLPLAIAAAQKALEIDPELAEAHTSMALAAQNYEWDWPKASHEYQRALVAKPNYATAHHWYGEFLGMMGKFDQSLRELERARELDPLSTIISTDICKVLYHARRYDQAIEQCRKTLNMDPRFVPAWQWLGLVYRKKGMIADAVTAVDEAAQLDPNPITLIEADIYRASARSRAQALEQVGRMKELWKQGSLAAYHIAYQYAWFGENDLAFEWLEKATAERTPWVVGFTKIPTVDPIRSDPRYDALVRRLGLNRVSME